MASKFTKNTLITLLTRILQLIFAIGTSVIIARVLGPEGKGVYALALLLPSILVALTDLGVGPASVYYIGKKKYSSKEIFGANIIYSFLISIFAISIGLIVVLFFREEAFPGVPKEYLLLALSLIPFQVFLTLVVDVLLGLRKIKEYNFVQLVHTFMFLFLIAIFLLGFHFGIRAAIICEAVSLFLSCIVLFFLVIKETQGVLLKCSKDYFKNSFFYGIKAYSSNVLSFLHARIDMWMLNFFLNPIAAGFYSVAVGVAEKLWLISQSAGTVIFPEVSSESNSKRLKEFTPLICRNVLFISFLGAIALFLMAPLLITFLYSKQYSKSVLPLQILLLGIIPISGSRILSNDFAGRGKPILNTYLNGFSVITNVVLNLIFIPKWGIAGAAWASTISYTLVASGTFVVYAKISGNKISDIIFIKRSDLKRYRSFISSFKKKYFTN